MNIITQRLLRKLQYINWKHTIQAKIMQVCCGLLKRWNQNLQVPQPLQEDHYRPTMNSKQNMKLQWIYIMEPPTCLVRVDLAPPKLNYNGRVFPKPLWKPWLQDHSEDINTKHILEWSTTLSFIILLCLLELSPFWQNQVWPLFSFYFHL